MRATEWRKWDWVLLALIAPVLLFPEVLPPALVSFALVLVPVYLSLLWRKQGPRIGSPLDLPVLTLLVSVGLCLWASADLSVSLPKLAGILLGICVLFALRPGEPGGAQPAWIAAALLALGAAMGLVALVGTEWESKFPLLDALAARLPRWIGAIPHVLIPGRGIHPNEVGGTFALLLPLGLAATWRAWRIAAAPALKLVTALVTALFLLLLLLAQSRSAFAGVACGLALLLAMVAPRLRGGLLAAGLVLAAGLLTPWGQDAARVVWDTFGATEGATLDWQGRTEVWARAFDMLSDFPVTGIGLNLFGRVAPALYPFFRVAPDTVVPHAHNILLQVGVDLGLPGLVSYAGLLSAFGACLWRAYRDPRGAATRWIAAGAGAGMLAHQVYGLTDAVALGAKPGILFWMMLALAASLSSGVRKGEAE